MESNASIFCGPGSIEDTDTCFYEALLPSNLPLPASWWSSLKLTDVLELLAPMSVSQRARIAIVSVVLLAVPFLVMYIATWRWYAAQNSKRTPTRVPPTVPYMVPYLGSALRFGFSPSKCVTGTRLVYCDCPVYLDI
jgi:hypothetical protein